MHWKMWTVLAGASCVAQIFFFFMQNIEMTIAFGILVFIKIGFAGVLKKLEEMSDGQSD